MEISPPLEPSGVLGLTTDFFVGGGGGLYKKLYRYLLHQRVKARNSWLWLTIGLQKSDVIFSLMCNVAAMKSLVQHGWSIHSLLICKLSLHASLTTIVV